ncbi:hypothetical protein B0H10DRAFT_2308861 [Mycena sp. CBHHK59/15]|nr:hypothetical protein B0H10DRAFT_2308861 [Mycena sp. CBHHK59/15]
MCLPRLRKLPHAGAGGGIGIGKGDAADDGRSTESNFERKRGSLKAGPVPSVGEVGGMAIVGYSGRQAMEEVLPAALGLALGVVALAFNHIKEGCPLEARLSIYLARRRQGLSTKSRASPGIKRGTRIRIRSHSSSTNRNGTDTFPAIEIRIAEQKAHLDDDRYIHVSEREGYTAIFGIKHSILNYIHEVRTLNCDTKFKPWDLQARFSLSAVRRKNPDKSCTF